MFETTGQKCLGTGVGVVALYAWLSRRSIRRPRVVVVSELWLYPVKSCGGVQVEETVVHRGGLQWDREFAIMMPDGEILSQKM